MRLLDTLPGVVAVRMPTYVVADPPPAAPVERDTTLTGTKVTEGLAAMNGPAWHSAGFTGQGVKVGVIDMGFGDYASLRGTELPSTVGLWQCPACQLIPGDNHGTACAEVIMDIVPQATLYLAQMQTTVDNVSAAQWLRGQGVDVISESVGFTASGPGDGTGTVQSEIGGYTSAGGLWVVSAGNWRQFHWQGHWTDGDADGWLEFLPGQEWVDVAEASSGPVWYPPLSNISADLVWNQWTAPQTDLEFMLMERGSLGGQYYIADASVNPQTGQVGQEPWEHISYTTLLGGWYAFAVQRRSGPENVDVEVFTSRLPLYPNIPSGSLLSPSDAPGAFTVAALDAGSPYTLEAYSSAGPTNGPGGSLTGGSMKPDISGYANVSTWSYGLRTAGQSFNGTSAACPHVAGAAALVWSAYPSYTNAQVRQLLESRAVNMGPAGKDNDCGYGRLYLGNPPGAAPTASFAWTPTSPTAGQTVTFTDTSTGSPTSWSWDFGDGGTSTQRNPTHAFSTAGTYSVRLTAANAYGSDQETRSITVRETGGGGDGEPVFIPAAAHAAGAAGTFFVTDVRVFNPGDSAVTVDLYFTPSGTTTRQHATIVVGSGEVEFLPDLVLGTFGQSSGVGAIEIRPSGGAVMATSRTYNTAASGTYGQFVDGRPASEAVGLGVRLHLLQIAKSSLFRANVGFCETTGSSATVRLRMVDEQGAQLGSKTYDIGAYGFKQVNDVFSDLGVSARDNVRVTVEVTAGSGEILAYASVVDNLSSDQICVPAQPEPSTGDALFVAAGASAVGAQGSLWKTDLRVANVATASRTVRISLLPNGQSNSSPTSVTRSLAAGAVLALDDGERRPARQPELHPQAVLPAAGQRRVQRVRRGSGRQREGGLQRQR